MFDVWKRMFPNFLLLSYILMCFPLFKRAILYGKINSNNANYCDINMMSKLKAPIHDYKNPGIYYENDSGNWQKKFGNFYLAKEPRYINLKLILGSSNFNFTVPNRQRAREKRTTTTNFCVK